MYGMSKKEESMKKNIFIATVILFTVSSVFALNFSPTMLKLNVPQTIAYKFDGSQLQIPVTVSGKPSNTIFMVYTKDQASAIGKVKNGLLGWHYVNKIDTCLYWKSAGRLAVGSNTVLWDGKNTSGTLLPAGAYTYYLWGYDDQSPKTLALTALNVSSLAYTESRDVKGLPLANPIMYIGLTKWPVGIDPNTALNQLETTSSGRTGITRFGTCIALDPLNHNKFWQGEISTNLTLYVTKYNWVPNGTSTMETTWGENGSFTWTTQPGGSGTFGPGVVDDGMDLLFMSFVNQYSKDPVSRVISLNMSDGTQDRIIDLSNYYCNQIDSNNGGQMNGGPSQINFRNNRLFTQGQQSCMALAIDPYRDSGDEILWVNANGDYVHDYHYNANDTKPWMCNDFNVGPYMYTYSTDSNEFSVFPAYDLGSVTFGLFGPAGTGIGYFAVAGETANLKFTARFMDEGSAFDGLYTDNNSASTGDKAGTWFVGYDSAKGVISNSVVVNENAPAAFSVMQNTPNPFNPTTTINFTMAKAGKVTVDVYNAAGQKIDTIMNSTLNPGSHSVTWNASNFSSGMYFYTLKSGDFSKTMRMTLLR
jgi:flagellar hook assembly protein FlgD